MNHLINLVAPNAECTLEDCPPGLFVYNNELCFKTRDLHRDDIEAYYMDGAYFEQDIYYPVRNKLMVHSVKYFIEPYISRAQLPLADSWTNDLTTIEGERILLNKIVEETNNEDDL